MSEIVTLTSLMVAAGLSVDAFAVSVARGSQAPRLGASFALKVALLFGLFQALMPVVGWAAGVGLKDTIAAYDHWVAFSLLSLLGGKMIYQELRPGGEEGGEPAAGTGTCALLVLALATSVDALAVGFSFNFLPSITGAAVVIGLTTFAVCWAGVHLGHRYRRLNASRVQVVGGAVLIAVGLKILLEHIS